jgi:hypothetical protein
VIEIYFPAQHRDLEERERFVRELCSRTDHHPSMFPLAISSCLSPSKFPTSGPRKRVDRMTLPFCIKSPFLLLVLANQDFLVGLSLWQMKETRGEDRR